MPLLLNLNEICDKINQILTIYSLKEILLA